MSRLKAVFNSSFNIIVFAAIVIVLNTLFYIYVGLVTPGGSTYSPFLEKYFNLPVWTANGLAKLSATLLNVIGFETYQKSLKNISIIGGGGANITWGCIGFGVISCWIAFVVAHKARKNFKMKWLIAGILFVFVLNVFRLMLIPVAIHNNWHFISSLNVHTSFNIACYILLIIISIVFVRNYQEHENIIISNQSR